MPNFHYTPANPNSLWSEVWDGYSKSSLQEVIHSLKSFYTHLYQQPSVLAAYNKAVEALSKGGDVDFSACNLLTESQLAQILRAVKLTNCKSLWLPAVECTEGFFMHHLYLMLDPNITTKFFMHKKLSEKYWECFERRRPKETPEELAAWAKLKLDIKNPGNSLTVDPKALYEKTMAWVWAFENQKHRIVTIANTTPTYSAITAASAAQATTAAATTGVATITSTINSHATPVQPVTCMKKLLSYF